MFERRSIGLPIALGVLMILAIVALAVGWVLLNVGVFKSWVYVVSLSVGSVLLLLVLAGVITYLTLSIKAINLTRRQSNFIDSVTHELKSPIASLKLYLQTMNKRELSDEERDKFLQFMTDDVDRLDGLISHLLDARTMEKNVADKEIVVLQLDKLIEECAATVCGRYRVEPETIELQLKPVKLAAEQVDAVMIFRNLLDNAVKYAGSPPQVHVSMRTERGEIVVEISDNGEGIPLALRRKVFGRFVRIGEELQRKKPGTGLGLYIVRTLVKRLGGRVRVLDRDKRWGTVFEVRLPKAD
jgi:signal transduction histidine kinase